MLATVKGRIAPGKRALCMERHRVSANGTTSLSFRCGLAPGKYLASQHEHTLARRCDTGFLFGQKQGWSGTPSVRLPSRIGNGGEMRVKKNLIRDV